MEGTSPESLLESDAPWWLVHTKPRNEKALSRDLERMGIGHFLPLAKVERRYGDRAAAVRIPLFAGYLFLCGGPDERYAVLMTHRAAGVYGVANQQRLKADLRQIHRVTSGEEAVDVYPGIQCGRRCRVARGSLQGLEGVVLMRKGKCRVYVAVEILGQSAEVEIDAAMLEVMD
jgi:transcriptional antiterminator RfaH